VNWTQKLWFGRTRWFWVKTAFAVLALSSIFGHYTQYRILQDSTDEQVARTHHEALQDHLNCEHGNDLREAVRDLIRQSYSAGVSLDLTKLPSFNDLDPATQRAFAEITNILKSNADPAVQQDRVNQALMLVPLSDCNTLYPVP